MNIRMVRGYSRHVACCSADSKPPLAKRIASTVALGTALAGSCIISFPYILRSKVGLKSCTTLIGVLQPQVAVSLQGADIGWFVQKPSLVGLTIRDRASANRDIFTCRRIRGSRSLFDVIIRKKSADVFVDHPHLHLTEAVKEASPSLRDDHKASNAFSAEFVINDHTHVYISEGSLDLTETVCAMLDGRLFVEAADMHGEIVAAVESPGFKANVQGTRRLAASPSLALSSPIHVEARVTKLLSQVLLKRINPLLAGGMDVELHSESIVCCDIQPDTGVLPAKTLHVRVSGYSFRIRQSKVVKDLLGVISNFSTDLKRSLSKDIQMTVISDDTRVIVDQDTGTMTTSVPNIAIDIPGYQHRINLSISGDIQSDDTIDMHVSIASSTLEDIFGIKGGPLVLRVKGSSARPRLLIQKAIIDLGLLVAQNM